MPTRLRTHELEAESNRAFRAALPSSWVVREISPDYGIDVEVEIFENGRSTGSIFKVQLKSTDNSDIPPKLVVKCSHLNYWRSLDVPVLIVLFVAPTSNLYWTWSLDQIFRLPKRAGQKTFTAKFESGMSSVETSPQIIQSQFLQWRERRRGDLHTPVVVQADLEKLSVACKSEVLAGLVEASGSAKGLAQITTDVRAAHQAVAILDDNSLDVRLVLGASFAIRPYAPNSSTGADILSLLAHCLFREGRQTALAAQIAACSLQSSNVVGYIETAMDFGGLLCAGGMLADLQQLIDIESVIESSAAIIYTLALFRCIGQTTGGLEAWIVSERRTSLELETKGLHSQSARRRYGLGSILRTEGMWEEAIQELEEAARLDPVYKRRSYWWREIGGASFLLGDFVRSANSYRMAVELGDSISRFPLADALMNTGDYEDARKVIGTVVDEGNRSGPEIRFKRALLDRAAESGIRHQDRQISSAVEAAQEGNVEVALELDFLCVHAWMARAEGIALAGQDPIPDLRMAVGVDVTDPFTVAVLIFECLTRLETGEYELILADAIGFARRSNNEVREILRDIARDRADEVSDAFDNHPSQSDLDTAITLRIYEESESSDDPDFILKAPREFPMRRQL